MRATDDKSLTSDAKSVAKLTLTSYCKCVGSSQSINMEQKQLIILIYDQCYNTNTIVILIEIFLKIKRVSLLDHYIARVPTKKAPANLKKKKETTQVNPAQLNL